MISLANTDDSFIKFIKRTGILYSHCVQLYESNADACDIVQDVFVKYLSSKIYLMVMNILRHGLSGHDQ